MIKVDDSWGRYGSEPPCEHLIELREFLENNQITVWSEHGEEPAGWVNLHCTRCGRTYETTLRPHESATGEEIWTNEPEPYEE